MRFRHITGLTAALLLTSELAAADPVTDWNATAVDVGRRQKLGANRATRVIAIAQLGVYDAVVSVTRSHEPYLSSYLSLPPGPISLEAAVAQAAHDVLLSLQPKDAVYLGDKLALSLDEIPDGPAKENGIALGHDAATRIVFARLADASAIPQVYEQPANPGIGKWIPTPLKPVGGTEPAGLPALDPEWRDVTPFGLPSGSEFRPPAPPAVSSTEYTEAFDEVKDLGALASATRTAAQTDTANFWRQETQIPFNAIARSLSARQGLSLVENARLFALLNVALADARIAAWDSKYFYGTWRPITAIRYADDGNADTEQDATWAPYLETPNYPEYASGHSATGAAAAAVLAAYFGDTTTFTVGSDTLIGARQFKSFTAAAEENAESRVYAGIAFRYSTDAGLALGTEVGSYVAQYLLPEAENTGGPGGEGGAGGAGGEGGVPSEAGAGGTDVGGSGGAPVSQAGRGGSTAGTGAITGEGASAGDSEALAGAGGAAGGSSGGRGGTAGRGGATPEVLEDDEGCSCSVVGGNSRGSALAWVSGLALAGVWLRRSRRR